MNHGRWRRIQADDFRRPTSHGYARLCGFGITETLRATTRLSQKFLEQNPLSHRLVGNPRYDSGRTHPYHPKCARYFARSASTTELLTIAERNRNQLRLYT